MKNEGGGDSPVTSATPNSARNRKLRWWWLWLVLAGTVATVQAQTCQSAAYQNPSTRSSVETSAKHYFDLASRADYAALRQNSIEAVASNFGGIAAAVTDNRSAFTGAHVTVRPIYLLSAEGDAPLARAEFLCGVFGRSGQTPDSAVFVLNNLPPGKYAVAILDIKGTEDARTLTLIMQQIGSDWKLAGFYVRLSELNGHDGAWFAQQARAFKDKGQTRNAWLYYREAIALSSPVDFMSTLATDKLYDEIQSVVPSNLPANGGTSDLAGVDKTYWLTEIFPLAVGSDLDLVVKYQVADVSDTTATFRENQAVLKALLAKFPEFRDAFAGVVVRAVEPSGRDYGTLVGMKDIK
jgi:hypothetical protein